MKKVLIIGSSYPEKSFHATDNNIKLEDRKNKYYVLTDSWLCDDDEFTSCDVNTISKYTSAAEYYCALDPNDIKDERLDNRIEQLFIKAVELITMFKIDEVHVNDLLRYGFVTILLEEYCNVSIEVDLSSINIANLLSDNLRSRMYKQLVAKAKRVYVIQEQIESVRALNRNCIIKKNQHLDEFHSQVVGLPNKLVILSSFLFATDIEHTKNVLKRLSNYFEIVVDSNDRNIKQLNLNDLIGPKFSIVNLSPKDLRAISQESIITTFNSICGRISHPHIYGEIIQCQWFSRRFLLAKEILLNERFNNILSDYRECSYEIDDFKIIEY